jgi:zinc transport system permease protein
MEALYGVFAAAARDGALPDVLGHPFMVRALLAAILAGPLLGLLGALVLPRRMAFYTQTVAHATLTGVAIGLVLGEPLGGTWVGSYGFCIAVAVSVRWLERRTDASEDTVVGVMLALVLGLGIATLVLATRNFDVHQIEAILFGSLLTVSETDLLVLAGTGLIAVPALLALWNTALLAHLAPSLARARERPSALADYAFAVLLTLVVVATVEIVGALLVLALIVVPAAGAGQLSRTFPAFVAGSVAIATLAALAGLLVSAWLALPTGAAIVLVAAVAYLCTLLPIPIPRRS